MSFQWIDIAFQEALVYDGLANLEGLLNDLNTRVAEEQKVSILDVALRVTPTRWWYMHRKELPNWYMVETTMINHFASSKEAKGTN